MIANTSQRHFNDICDLPDERELVLINERVC
jgi:hypothetical protein